MESQMLSGIWDFGIATLLLLLQLAGLFLAGRVILSDRSTHGTIAWVLSLVLLPLAAVPLYLMFGRNRLDSYIRSRRRVNEEFRRVHPVDPQDRLPPKDPADGETPLLGMLEDLTRIRVSVGNHATAYFEGRNTFASIEAGIQGARDYILFQFFIYRNDRVGRHFAGILKKKAREGVAVYFMVDAIGCRKLKKAFFRDLEAAGVKTGIFLPGRTIRGRLRLNFRNHRKVVVVDGREAWLGGHNVGREYMGEDPRFGPWRDSHVQVSGPVVQTIQQAFMEDWYWVNREMLPLKWDAAPADGKNIRAICLATGPTDPDDTCTLAHVHLINQAQHRLWIHSPYFVPSEEVIVALQLATLRGVDVRVLLPSGIDHLMVWLSSYYYSSLPQLRRVRFFRYTRGFLHSKMLLVDNDLVSIGTINFDNRSFRINFEITLMLQEADFITACRTQMEKDFAHAEEDPPDPLALRSPAFRLAARSTRLLAPLL